MERERGDDHASGTEKAVKFNEQRLNRPCHGLTFSLEIGRHMSLVSTSSFHCYLVDWMSLAFGIIPSQPFLSGVIDKLLGCYTFSSFPIEIEME